MYFRMSAGARERLSTRMFYQCLEYSVNLFYNNLNTWIFKMHVCNPLFLRECAELRERNHANSRNLGRVVPCRSQKFGSAVLPVRPGI